MNDYVTVYHRDICAEGFVLTNLADAVFLDIPNPWKAIKSAKDAMKQEGMIHHLLHYLILHIFFL